MVPPNSDDQIQSTVVHEAITLPRTFPSIYPHFLSDDPAELLGIITHTAGAAQPFDFYTCTTPCR